MIYLPTCKEYEDLYELHGSDGVHGGGRQHLVVVTGASDLMHASSDSSDDD